MELPLSYIEISKQNILHNFSVIRAFIHPDTKIACVIKANAYGHGQNEVAKILEPVADYFQVDDLAELRLLRTVSNKPTLVFGYVAKQELEEALTLHGILTIYDTERLQQIDTISKKVGTHAKVHIKIDSFLGRQGLLIEDIEPFLRVLKPYRYIDVDGIYAHFANIEDTSDFSHAQKQIDGLDKALDICKTCGYTNIKHHISATSGILVYEKDTGKNHIVRLGIGLYGMWPSEKIQKKYQRSTFTFKPALRWVTHIAQVKILPKNYSIGYGLTYITKAITKIAIVPQGYSDGYDRGLSNNGVVLINGIRCNILGRITMNMFMVDVTNIKNVKAEDEVVLLGSQQQACMSAEEIANQINTINYEVTTRISPLLPRITVPHFPNS